MIDKSFMVRWIPDDGLRRYNQYHVGVVILVMTMSFDLQAQVEYPSLSPKGIISQRVGNTNIKIEYERPSARKRKVFGDLVPWNKVWRTGAGYCTKLSVDRDVFIEGQPIKAGKYSIFSIPNPDQWVIIVNADTTLYGSYAYDTSKDVARFVVNSFSSSRYYETLSFDIDIVPNNAKIYLSWEHTAISFNLVTSTDEIFMRYVDESLLTEKEEDYNRYSNAAEQLYYLNARLKDALVLTDIALKMNHDDGFARRVKMELLEKLHQYDEAMEVIHEALKMVKDENSRLSWMEHQKRISSKIDSVIDQH